MASKAKGKTRAPLPRTNSAPPELNSPVSAPPDLVVYPSPPKTPSPTPKSPSSAPSSSLPMPTAGPSRLISNDENANLLTPRSQERTPSSGHSPSMSISQARGGRLLPVCLWQESWTRYMGQLHQVSL